MSCASITSTAAYARAKVVSVSEETVVETDCAEEIFTWMESGVELDEVPREELLELDGELLAAVSKLESTVRVVPPTEETTKWWRGFGKEADQRLRETGRWESTRITSLTAKKGVAECFGVAWRVIVPAEERVLYISLLKRVSKERRWPTIDAEEEALVGKGVFTRVGEGRRLVFRGTSD